MNPDDAVARTIHNRRKPPRRAVAVGAVVGALGYGVLACLADQLPTRLSVPIQVAMGVLLLGATVVCLRWAARVPVDRVKLGEWLEVWPGGHRPIADVLAVVFGPDPAEDYAELSMPVPLCRATITLRRGPAADLIVSRGDAARLREWAIEHGVPVSDPGGYSRPIRD